ncbi:MAG: hypothetical protein LKF49_08030 [Bifidobacterium tibiigranuli]|jgi:hypothetical protein|uniref:hypothetical protein n=1 Tax=Bifidobacterium tibiigranuli TaxID=2172043 RepID=UPI0023525D78|nr:hypothetical protein [Bifidobacterium tibiigranuli]MCH3975501.1 hypothetical protein [Bifidobacterium tibiigranuli]MCH4204140.1 hypothetical protein [Bifidobacterium tibiigranuli]MCH4274663.1 hypothetical protein [Bifidobacterium tibiigranuli]MCI1649383.1 hypothetical protein [Bifidobacterium tibiigranuli]MCI1672971.1 hypothetical protein [Bifidobacterium tibiigranuli]
MIQSTAAIYDDGSATLTVNGQRRKIRERDAQAARSAILTILVRDAATLKEDHALNVLESDGQHHFVVRPDGSLVDTQEPEGIATTALQPATEREPEPEHETAVEPLPVPDEVTQPINEATTQQLEPVSMNDDGPAPTSARRLPSVSRIMFIKAACILAGALILVAAAAGCMQAWHSAQHGKALQSCQSALTSQEQAIAARTKSLATAHELNGIQPAQLTNPSSLATLQKAQTSMAERLTISCTSSLTATQLTGRADRLATNASAIQSDTSAIVRAARVVVASRDAKSLADAKSSLANAVKAAQGTLDSSHGRVADNKTRESLQKSLDAANKVLADKGVKDPKKYRDAQATLAAPVKSVNDSVAAKAAADKAAADKAAAAAQAAAQAQAQSRSSAGSSSSSSSSKSYSRSSGSGSSGSTTQRKTTSNGSSGSSSGSGSAAPSWSVPSSGSDEGNIGGSDPDL